MNDTQPTHAEQTEFSIRAFRGIDVGLGQADPGAAIAAKLEAQHPDHLILVQAGKFLHGYDRTAYALHILKKYQLKIIGSSNEPHLRVGFPAGNFKRRLWPMVAEFGIPYVVALGTQAAGHTVYVSSEPTGNASVLATVSDDLMRNAIDDLRQRGELNKAAAKQLLANPDTAGFKLKSHAQDLDTLLLQDVITDLVDSFRTGDRYDALFPPDSPYHQTTAKGMPIGNLSSQLFANIYLNDFDHWMKEQLRVRWYIRYVDDMVVLGNDPAELREIGARIVEHLSSDGLVIHPRKVRLAPVADGIPFLGYVVWPHHVSAGRYIRGRYLHRLRQHENQGIDRTESLTSYRAMLAHTGATR